MIVQPAVLVLGAGASKAYGFPTGPELADQVVRELASAANHSDISTSTTFAQTLASFNSPDVKPELYAPFVEAFHVSSCSSLDEFVQSKGNGRFLPLVKAATIAQLPNFEKDDALTPGRGD